MAEKKILVVDDEAHILVTLKKMLIKEGYDVRTAASSEEALVMVAQEGFHLVLVDIRMPGQNGIQLCEQIRKKHSRMIILALSGYVTEHEQEKIRECGFNGYLNKPIKRRIIKEAIEVALETEAERE